MKAYFDLDNKTKDIILELVKKCIELDLGNINFTYYNVMNSRDVNFYISEYNSFWELIVKCEFEKGKVGTDIYKIVNSELKYEYSEYM